MIDSNKEIAAWIAEKAEQDGYLIGVKHDGNRVCFTDEDGVRFVVMVFPDDGGNHRPISAEAARMKRRYIRQRDALGAIIDAANATPEPCHFKIREAIELGKQALRGND